MTGPFTLLISQNRQSTMQAARTLLRRTHLVQRVLTQTSSSSSSQARIGVSRHLPSRYFSVQAATATVNENFVKEAIKKMMLDRDQEDDNPHFQQHPISDDELKSRFESFQHLYDEARLCIKDCEDAVEHIMEESECAKNAVDQAFSSYVEILEDLRRASEAQLQMYNGARSQNAVNLKALRQELDTIQQNR